MNFKFYDTRISFPHKDGKYIWWSKQLGHIPVTWINGRWYFLNNDRIPGSLVRWWK